MIIGILQPGYLPWLGFFEQLHKSDIFVIYDDVQYDKNGWRNRNRIKTANGVQWLTVPVCANSSLESTIDQVRIENSTNWRKKHFQSIRQNYSKTPYFKKYIPLFEEAYSISWEYLIDIDIFFINRLADCIGLENKKIVRSSNLEIEGSRLERLVAICRHFRADVFYEGAAGQKYLIPEEFEHYGIKVEFQNYQHPQYKQLYGKFISHLSMIDLLFNYGDKSLSVLLTQKNN